MHWRVIIITCCFAITCNVIESFAHYILDVNVTKPWLTIDRFAKLLELSLNTSRCTNIHVFGEFDQLFRRNVAQIRILIIYEIYGSFIDKLTAKSEIDK